MSDTLYERLGAKPGVDRLVDRVIDLHLNNERIRTRFSSLDDEALQRSRRLGKEFFCVGTGGPGEYHGRSMPEAHAGMNISADEFLAVIDDIMTAMKELDYPRPVCDEVLGIAYSLKDEIVHQ